MGRVEGRSAEDTRQLILDAASRVVLRDGLAASLESVAAEAGVSKGGLLYHFSSKAALTEALARELYESFRRSVHAAIAPDDDAPGRLLRAYVRVSIADAHDAAGLHDSVALAAHVMGEPARQAIAHEDGQRWREDLDADGLPSHVVRLVVAAADGVSVAPLWGTALTTEDLDQLERQLLDLTTGYRNNGTDTQGKSS
ncbi:TetR/AcrR family transcriptional regulator [Demequina sediminicola]|uniref:TetR/AcrR family transcriptional regulator n=1 Tax=Demequina sediminicola TaxID=1095026 RepID=UPI0007832D6F|nr:TetR family transcriptional regulator [Demequina sediminicola]